MLYNINFKFFLKIILPSNSNLIHYVILLYKIKLKWNINSLAVLIANNICIESKKKNITNSDIEAPSGKHNACIVSKVWTSIKKKIIKN